MAKVLSSTVTTFASLLGAFFTMLLTSSAALAHQGIFSHASVNHSVLHFLIHALMFVSLGVTVFLISRWWLNRNAKTVQQKTHQPK